jgi:predicted transcriptional regulator
MTVQQRVLIHLVEQQQGLALADLVKAVHATNSEVAHALGSLQLRGCVTSSQGLYRVTDMGMALAPRFTDVIAQEKRRPVGVLRQSERGDHSDARSDVAASSG